MSIQALKQRKFHAIQVSLEQCKDFDFAEGLRVAFQMDSGKRKVKYPSFKQNEAIRLEPIFVIRDSIRPLMTRVDIDQVMSEAPGPHKKDQEKVKEEEEEEKEEILQDITALLDSMQMFTSSSSQIPIQQKSSVLQDLVKLSLPSLKIAIASVNFNLWPIDIIADLYREISSTENIPTANAALLIHATAFKRTTKLTSTAPRLLMNCIISLAKDQGRAILDGLLIPLLFGCDLTRLQLEVILKTISESLNQAQRLHLLRVILSDGEVNFSMNHSLLSNKKYLRPWNDTIFQILNTTLSVQPFVKLDKDYLFDIVRSTQTIVQTNAKDKGSMQLLLVLTSKYAQTLVEFNALTLVEQIAQASDMFLKRSVLGQVASIKKNMQP